MPNWVYTSMAVSGKTDDLLAFAEKAKTPYPSQWLSESWIRNEDGTNTQVPEDERTIVVKEETPDAISFWNFLRPTDEELPYYFGHKTKPEDEADPDATSEERMAKALTFAGSGWYDWNVREWGTKWDANDDCLNTELSELDDSLNNSLSYSFSTAWSPAEGVFRAMAKQHPELTFEFYCEEEQGWGVVFDGQNGELSVSKEWDIPDSHADYVALDREDSCLCGHYEDESDWYADCPRETKEFFVEITRTYKVIAKDAEQAWELANDTADGLELMTDETTCLVKNELGQRVYPIAENGVE